ncbi:MAG TPA: DUF402 domain-containing protein [Lachnospiraceae bacterium]|nr:DUF402 domain-containing protein [Lachnospiraceae bacterium]
MTEPILYRKRLIPEECILLKDDIILEYNDDIILTKWNALKPKKDLHHGYSCYFKKEGYKVSKFYQADNSLLYWYCDIVDYEYDAASNKLVVVDLLADVIIYPDHSVKVVDLDEMVTALDAGLITIEQLKHSITQLDKLLQIIYQDQFYTLTKYIEEKESDSDRLYCSSLLQRS